MTSQEDHQYVHSPYCPSFNAYSKNNYSSNNNNRVTHFASDTITDDFEFHLDDEAEINKMYPLFARELLGSSTSDNDKNKLKELFFEEDRDQVTTTSEEDEEGVPSESYYPWASKSPSQGKCTKTQFGMLISSKSNSTGSGLGLGLFKIWRLKNLLRRSKSDGKEGLTSFGKKDERNLHPSYCEIKSKNYNSGNNNKKSSAHSNYIINGISNNEFGYINNNNNYNKKVVYSPAREEWEKRRRSYLPYKQDLLGFFGSPQTLRKINIP